MRVGGTEAVKQAVAAGLGLAIVSRAAAADQLALGRIAVLRVEGLEIRRTLAQIILRGRSPTWNCSWIRARSVAVWEMPPDNGGESNVRP